MSALSLGSLTRPPLAPSWSSPSVQPPALDTVLEGEGPEVGPSPGALGWVGLGLPIYLGVM